jgi:hypothetical protein
MRKILTGIVFAIILLLGVSSYSLMLRAQQRAEQELTGSFAALRVALGSGSIGKVEVDLRNRTFKVSDIELQTASTPRTTFKIRELTATGIDLPADWRLSAERIEALDVEIGGSIGPQPAVDIVYKAPRITITDFSGPIALLRPVDTSSFMDVMRLVLEHFVATAATSVAIPTLTATLSPSTPGPQPTGPARFTYTDIELRDIRNGHVADMSIERTQFTITTPAEALGRITGEGGRASTADFDAGVLLAVLDSAKPKDDRLLHLQGRSMAGPYTVRFENGGGIQIGAIEVDNVGVRPAKLRFAELMALTEALRPRIGRPDSTAEMDKIANLMADIHEGISIGLFEVRGVTLNVPQTPPFRLGAFRMKGLENGKLVEVAVENVEGQTPQQQPFKIGRFALKGLDVANMDRSAGQLGAGGPTPEKIASLIPLLEGVEITDLIGPYKDTRSTINIESFAASWGKFVGPIPTAARVTARISGPLDVSDPNVLMLLAGAGITSAIVNFDLGAYWTEATSDFALAPMRLEIGNLFSLAARVSVGNVPRELFTVDPDQAMLAARQVEAGLAEFELRDDGALDLAITQFARQQAQPERAARTALIDILNQAAAPLIAGNPELQPAVAAIARFIETPRSTLTIRMIPKGHVPLQMAIEAATADPTTALSHFRVEVTASR